MRIYVGVVCLLGPGVVSSSAKNIRIHRIEVESSSIASAGYRRATKQMEIEFRSGAIYRYREVAESVFTAFSAARSKGNFFSTQIRGKYAFDKLQGPTQ